jgi:hypothetical protein
MLTVILSSINVREGGLCSELVLMFVYALRCPEAIQGALCVQKLILRLYFALYCYLEKYMKYFYESSINTKALCVCVCVCVCVCLCVRVCVCARAPACEEM